LGRLTVPCCDREHAVATAQRLYDPEAGNGLHQHFRVGMATPRKRTAVGKRFAELAMVVDLAIERNDPTPIGGRHGLRTGIGQVDDRQPSVCQSDRSVRVPYSLTVRPTMAQGSSSSQQ